MRILLPISIFSIGNWKFCIRLRTDVYSTVQRKGAKERKDAGRTGEIALFAEHAPREGNIF